MKAMRHLTLFAFLLVPAALLAQSSGMPAPQFNAAGRLIRPEGHREWMFVGSNLGMAYSDAAKPRVTYHNIYLQREAYQQYVKTGRFPDKTMMVMELMKPGSNASINKQGSFQDSAIGIEVALKDESRFAEKWAYFNFIGEGDKPLADAGAMKKDQCWKCHNEHGAVDNVFVQFYPILREARKLEAKK